MVKAGETLSCIEENNFCSNIYQFRKTKNKYVAILRLNLYYGIFTFIICDKTIGCRTCNEDNCSMRIPSSLSKFLFNNLRLPLNFDGPFKEKLFIKSIFLKFLKKN